MLSVMTMLSSRGSDSRGLNMALERSCQHVFQTFAWQKRTCSELLPTSDWPGIWTALINSEWCLGSLVDVTLEKGGGHYCGEQNVRLKKGQGSQRKLFRIRKHAILAYLSSQAVENRPQFGASAFGQLLHIEASSDKIRQKSYDSCGDI